MVGVFCILGWFHRASQLKNLEPEERNSLPNNALQEALSKRFRRLLSGDPDGIPPWLEVIAAGDEPGLYMPTDAPWIVHADFGTLVGGIRALLMQALHPGSLTGVANHSRYEQDPLGRLAGTIRWLTVTTFGSHAAVAGESSRVNRLHTRVAGEQLGALEYVVQRRQHLAQFHRRRQPDRNAPRPAGIGGQHEVRPDDPRRVIDGEPYPPFHDAMMAVDGDAARVLGRIARDAGPARRHRCGCPAATNGAG